MIILESVDVCEIMGEGGGGGKVCGVAEGQM